MMTKQATQRTVPVPLPLLLMAVAAVLGVRCCCAMMHVDAPAPDPPISLPQCRRHQPLVLGEACVVNGTVTEDQPAVTSFSYPHSPDNTIVPRITSWSTANRTGHVGFFLSQSCGFQQWSLPLEAQGCKFPLVRRNICPDVSCMSNASDWEFSVTVTSLQQERFIYKAELFDTAVSVGTPRTITASPNLPAYLRLTFGDHEQLRIDVRTDAPHPLRSIISLQNSSCPLYDLDSNVRFEGFYETALHSSTFVLDRSRLGPDIFVVVIVLPDEHTCVAEPQDFVVDVQSTDDLDYTWPVMFVVVVFILVPYGLYMLAVWCEVRHGAGINEPAPDELLFLFRSHARRSKRSGAQEDWEEREDSALLHHAPTYGAMDRPLQPLHPQPRRNPHDDGGDDGRGEGQAAAPGTSPAAHDQHHQRADEEEQAAEKGEEEEENGRGGEGIARQQAAAMLLTTREANTTPQSVSAPVAPLSVQARGSGSGSGSGGIVLRAEWDTGHNYTAYDLHACRGQEPAMVSHLARKLPSIQEKKFKQYALYLIALMVFYALPVVQLVYSQLDHFHAGNQDLCYYNFRCSRPLWRTYSFNNFFSNLGYITLGLLFLLIVRRRRRLLAEEASNIDLDTATSPDAALGLPRHSGIFHAIGLAFVAEGVFSACYHTCPTPVNFQFDTSFMYVIGVLMALVLYQRRHNDALPNPHVTYLWIAALIFVVVIGVYWHSIYFYAIVLIVALPLSFIATLQLYFFGLWGCIAPKEPLPANIISLYFLNSFTSPRWCSLSMPRRKGRALLLLVINIITWMAIIAGMVTQFQDVPTFFLGLAIINYLIYFCYYVTMKLRHGERLTRLPVLVFVASLALWGAALYFFNDRASSFYLTPAASRDLNKECILFRFYDTHDLWHMLSAYGLFLNAIVLLSLDDDLRATPRARIPVF
ncbi:Msid2 [Salpingoeca rosetta]|uniref:Msid2 n=1 Tax=Salpingoeca rosetta (strain ATCC 50818 / BSB-021) TaxID=946362 RepID=F2UDL4_SALR5|nr:Msid2 [Salpingoeca rosetta]EGD74709.1 Msid2 [Salpingoeca rosetta]|eukprot:XP_004992966.1 Msid2 [Salpingoeca rosetta]